MQVNIYQSFSYNFLVHDCLSRGGDVEPPERLVFYVLYMCEWDQWMPLTWDFLGCPRYPKILSISGSVDSLA